MRGLEVARDSLDREGEVSFDARGLLHNEARLKADLRVSTLPDGLDPDEIVLRDPGEWQTIIDESKPIIHHVLDTLVKNQNIEDPKTKSDIAARILPLINDLPDPVERDAYRQQVARVLQVDERALLLLTSHKARPRRSRTARQAEPESVTQSAPAAATQDKTAIVEKQVLAYLAAEPEKIHSINRWLRRESLERRSPRMNWTRPNTWKKICRKILICCAMILLHCPRVRVIKSAKMPAIGSWRPLSAR
jgi:DNA primase